MFEQDAEEYQTKKRKTFNEYEQLCWGDVYKDWKNGAEFGYNKANEWHKVSDKLPEMDVFVYVWKNADDDLPFVARRHIPAGYKDWVWDCRLNTKLGVYRTQLAGKDYLWKEIVLPKGTE